MLNLKMYPSLKMDTFDLCAGQDSQTADELIQVWQTYDCPAAFRNYLNNSNGYSLYNPNNLSFTQESASNVFTLFTSSYLLSTTANASPNANAFSNSLYEFCLDPSLPGVCASVLSESICPSYQITGQFGSGGLQDYLCGCFISSDICQPYCHRADVVQLSQPSTGKLTVCQPTVCVIDNTYVQSLTSQVGSVNLVNLCPSCGPKTPCSCTIVSPNVSDTLAQLGNVHLVNACGSDSDCTIVDPTGNISTVPCSTLQAQNNTWPWLLLLYFLIFLIGGLLLWLFAWLTNRKRKASPKDAVSKIPVPPGNTFSVASSL